MTNKRDLKAFVRYDGSGRVVAGSLILRKQKPKVGKWKEIQEYQCCNAPILTAVPGDALPSANVLGSIDCGDAALFVTFGASSAAVGVWATVEEVVSALNAQCSYLGTFSVAPNGVNINLNPSFAIANSFSTNLSTLSLTINYNP
jgi:hypothetical protein